MRFEATDYNPEDIFRILREWTNMSQERFGRSINRSDRSVRMLESGNTHFSVQTLLNIAKIHNIKIIIEKR